MDKKESSFKKFIKLALSNPDKYIRVSDGKFHNTIFINGIPFISAYHMDFDNYLKQKKINIK